MRKQLAAILLLAGALPLPPNAAAQTLLWQDEFDGTALGPDWEPMIGDGTDYGLPAGWGNNEFQYYTDRAENVYVADGLLHIVAREEAFGGAAFTSARLRTAGHREFRYGRFEARMKIPSGWGLWPAFWMLPTNSPYGGWAASGEIDIMEAINQATTVYGTIHYGGAWPANTHSGATFSPGFNLGDDFHVYSIEWEPGRIRWRLDGVQYHEETAATWYTDAADAPAPPDTAPFDQDFHLLLNVAVGGNFPGPPRPSTAFPQELQVDWVRAYSYDRAPYPGRPHLVPGAIQAEDYDRGLEGHSYHDCDADNRGGAYRWDGVDVEPASGGGGGFNIGWMCPGEWLEYTVDVQRGGSYRLDIRTASPATGGAFSVLIDGLDITGPIVTPATGGWQTWRTDSMTVRLLPSGGAGGSRDDRIVRFSNGAGPREYNLDQFTLTRIGALADWDVDGDSDVFDLLAYLDQWFGAAAGAQLAPGPEIDVFDLLRFLDCWFDADACA